VVAGFGEIVGLMEGVGFVRFSNTKVLKIKNTKIVTVINNQYFLNISM
jgi:hypothetical protein